MKIEQTKVVNGKEITYVIYNGKEFYRFIGKKTQWKRKKSNHIVNKELHNALEAKFNNLPNSVKQKLPKSKIERFPSKLDLNEKLSSMCEQGDVLQAVKFYKEYENIGLKMAKDYVDSLNRIVKIKKRFFESNSESNIFLTTSVVNAYFESEYEKKKFSEKVKENTNGQNGLEVIRFIRDNTCLTLSECKYFYEAYIK